MFDSFGTLLSIISRTVISNTEETDLMIVVSPIRVMAHSIASDLEDVNYHISLVTLNSQYHHPMFTNVIRLGDKHL